MFLFRVTMASQGTPEQAARWVPLVDSMKVLGCFAMTELGHRYTIACSHWGDLDNNFGTARSCAG